MNTNGVYAPLHAAPAGIDTDDANGTALGSLSAAGTQATTTLLEQLAAGGTVDPGVATMLRLVAQDLFKLRGLFATPDGGDIAQLQQAIARTRDLDENGQILERAAVAALNELHSYQRDAPRSAPMDSHVVLDARALHTWGELALRVATAFEDLSLRCQTQAELLAGR